MCVCVCERSLLATTMRDGQGRRDFVDYVCYVQIRSIIRLLKYIYICAKAKLCLFFCSHIVDCKSDLLCGFGMPLHCSPCKYERAIEKGGGGGKEKETERETATDK